MAKVIGIDLGTTNSCVAVLDGSNTKIIENSEEIEPHHQWWLTQTMRSWSAKLQNGRLSQIHRIHCLLSSV